MEFFAFLIVPIVYLLILLISFLHPYLEISTVIFIIILGYTIYATTRGGRLVSYARFYDKKQGVARQTLWGAALTIEKNTQKLIEDYGEECFICKSPLRFFHTIENDTVSLIGVQPVIASKVICRNPDCSFIGGDAAVAEVN